MRVARMTGGGFGGCTVSLVQTSRVQHVMQVITEAYTASTRIVPTFLVSAAGAGTLKFSL
mgnify:CR=1 FL=1